jgi:surface antigen-like variable number repeat protein
MRIEAPPIALSALLLGACAHDGVHGTHEYPVVTKIEIVGAATFPREQIAALLYTMPRRRLPSDASSDGDVFAEDVARVKAFYESEGFLGVKVDARRIPEGGSRVRVQVRIEEGRPLVVSQLSIDGLEGFPQARAWTEALPLRVGERLTQTACARLRPMLLAALAGAGHDDAEMFVHLSAAADRSGARLSVGVAPGKAGAPYRFGPVFVAGAEGSSVQEVRDAARAVLRPEDAFDITRLETARRRILELGPFQRVSVSPGVRDEKTRAIPVIVYVHER